MTRRKKANDPRGYVPRPGELEKKKLEAQEKKRERAVAREERAREIESFEPAPVEPVVGTEDALRSGYVAIVGRPNVGKSTLLNQLLGQKIAATTHKPQTTRRTLLGILHPPGAQVMLLDTPGHHAAKGPLNRFMVQEARRAMADADVIALMIEARADGNLTPGTARLIEELKKRPKPIVAIINKIDRLASKNLLLPQLDRLQSLLGDQVKAIVPISAAYKDGLEEVVRALAEALPEGPRYFDQSQFTDQSERGIVAELIREKVILETKDELPYATAVKIEAFEDARPRIVRIAASIYVERDSQKGIVIGARGTRLKAIGTRARQEVERFVRAPVFLDLHVKVAESWSESPKLLADMGYATDRAPETELEVPEELDLPDDVLDDLEEERVDDA